MSKVKIDFAQLRESCIDERKADKHLYADYAELLCLAHPDKFITRSSFASFLNANDFFSSVVGKSVDQGISEDDAPGLDIEDTLTPATDEVFSSASEEECIYQEDVDAVTKDSNRELFFNDIFEHLLSRWLLIDSSFYPFGCNEAADRLVRKSRITNRHRIYLFFLCCSNLQYFPRASGSLTSAFEEICKHIFEQMLPKQAEVHIFGKGKSASTRYTGNKGRKINLLASDLNTKVLDDARFIETDNGDAGADIVGWIPTGDKSNGMLVFFGQCACGKNWNSKQQEVSYERWSQYFSLKHPNAKVVFIPYFLRDSSGDWPFPQEINSFLVDRLRLFHYFDKNCEDLISKDSRITLIKEMLDAKTFVF